jgi:hypothetical protein
MLWIIALVFALLWAVGLYASFTMGGLIHVLIVLAMAFFVAWVIRGLVKNRPGNTNDSVKPRSYK